MRAVAFGSIPGVPAGTVFPDRRALAAAGVHRALQAGIVGKQAEGAESVVLSGGYEDDTDWGDVILYTGQGGNRGGEQVADQQLNRGNLALANSLRHGLPVRVIRGAHPDVHDAPASGYRYDGLFCVADYWRETGVSGYTVWRFRLERVPQEPAPSARLPGAVREGQTEHPLGGPADPVAGYDPAPRRDAVVSRVVRDSAVTRQVKRLYRHRCQVCGQAVETPTGPYAEAAHIRPLGAPHNGPDALENVLCLCPNHHVQFDRGHFGLTDALELIGLEGRLRVHPRHRISPEHVRYHRTHVVPAERAA